MVLGTRLAKKTPSCLITGALASIQLIPTFQINTSGGNRKTNRRKYIQGIPFLSLQARYSIPIPEKDTFLAPPFQSKHCTRNCPSTPRKRDSPSVLVLLECWLAKGIIPDISQEIEKSDRRANSLARITREKR